jgi:hypothetical protein
MKLHIHFSLPRGFRPLEHINSFLSATGLSDKEKMK